MAQTMGVSKCIGGTHSTRFAARLDVSRGALGRPRRGPRAGARNNRRPTTGRMLCVCRGFDVESPSPEEAVELGVREWAGYLKKTADFEDSCSPGDLRYVMEGSGTVTDALDEAAAQNVEPGCLVRVTEDCTLLWNLDSEEIVLLTPKLEQPLLYFAVAGTVFGVLGYLVATSGGATN